MYIVKTHLFNKCQLNNDKHHKFEFFQNNPATQ